MTDTNATNAQEHQDKLTEEEHFANLLEEMRKGNIDFSNGQYKELFDQQNSSQERTSPEDPENCRHEIVINVQYQIVSINNKKEELGCVEAIQDSYTIPVPVQEKYKPFVEQFQKNFNESLTKTAVDLKLSECDTNPNTPKKA